MRIHTYTHCNKRFREKNEDRYEVIINFDKKIPEYDKIIYIGVYDGHGGSDISKYLENKLSKQLLTNKIYPNTDNTQILKDFDKIQNQLIQYNSSLNSGSTSLVGIISRKNNKIILDIFNTGDCRAVICKNNFSYDLTKDHKPCNPEEYRRIKSLGGDISYTDCYRIYGLSVSKSFGDFFATPYLSHVPDIFQYEITKSDKFVVFASDGLWDVMESSQVVNFILNECYDDNFILKTEITEINIAKKLTKEACRNCASDNITICVVFF